MKTSNKILTAAIGAFLLLTAVNTAIVFRDYNATKQEARNLLAQLEQNRVRVLIVEGGDSNYFGVSNMRDASKSQRMWCDGPLPDPEKFRFSNDTLYLKNADWGGIVLPDLESYLCDGQPRMIRNN